MNLNRDGGGGASDVVIGPQRQQLRSGQWTVELDASAASGAANACGQASQVDFRSGVTVAWGDLHRHGGIAAGFNGYRTGNDIDGSSEGGCGGDGEQGTHNQRHDHTGPLLPGSSVC
ncbi:hypothetical protein [Micromonospora gifhornensis]|uniref:hypothetical protein n=1 Tax=Micromonospora gifhornensis TaxID=84594 RepID=UPI0036564172